METVTQQLISFPLYQTPKPTHPHHQLLSFINSSSTFPQLKQIHAQMLRTGLDRSTSLLLKLVSSSLDYALSVFHQTPDPDPRFCNQILRQLSRSGEPDKTLFVYDAMRRKGVLVDRFSFPPLLKASARANALDEGREIHGLAAKMGFDTDPFVQTALVGAYAACGRVWDARLLFDKMSYRDTVTWSVMMDGYSRTGLYDEILLLFEEMKKCSNAEPDHVVLATVLSACGRTGNLNSGNAIHDYISENGFAMDPHLQSSLINMYANCGSMDYAHQLFEEMSPKNKVASTAMVCGYSKLGYVEIARKIFDRMPEKDLVSWSAMISGYAESDEANEALKLFNEMQASGIKPDQITMLSVISACAHLGALDQAKWIHIFVNKNGFSSVLSVSNALIDMYAKCGSLESAHRVFDKMHQRNVITWTSMITTFAMHGDANSALSLFGRMKIERIEANGVTFVGVLYACSHAGLVDEGRRIFASMIDDHKIEPKIEHYGCMVDLLGRANLLHEAFELIETMPFDPNIVVWGSLLGACRVHNNIELGEFAAKRLLELDPDHDGAYVLLSNIYAKANRWEDVGEVRQLMKYRGVAKERGCSWIEFNSEVHEFVMGDKSHSQAEKIYEKLDEIVGKLKLVGYVPSICSVLVDLEDEEKREAILLHSEKLALSFGLISLGKGSCIRIVKNLRVCEDCHGFMKLVSKVFEREIVVRDRTRFHHYKDGVCSCKDFW